MLDKDAVCAKPKNPNTGEQKDTKIVTRCAWVTVLGFGILRRYINQVFLTIKHTRESQKSTGSQNIFFIMFVCNTCNTIVVLPWVPSIYRYSKKQFRREWVKSSLCFLKEENE